MRLFRRLHKNKNENSKGFRREMAEKLNGRHIKYVTERDEQSNDLVIGREGALIVKDDELLVYASADVLFRAKIDALRAAELMSLDGVILTAPDLEHNEQERTVIAYYTYYL